MLVYSKMNYSKNTPLFLFQKMDQNIYDSHTTTTVFVQSEAFKEWRPLPQ